MVDQLAGAEKEVRRLRSENAMLLRDEERDAKKHPKWSAIDDLFQQWRQLCGKTARSKMNAKRFWLALPYLEKDGFDGCLEAIQGIAFDAFETRRKNGTTKRHNDWELVFRDRGKFEEMRLRAPHSDGEPYRGVVPSSIRNQFGFVHDRHDLGSAIRTRALLVETTTNRREWFSSLEEIRDLAHLSIQRGRTSRNGKEEAVGS